MPKKESLSIAKELQPEMTCNEMRDEYLKVYYGFRYKNESQRVYAESIQDNTITFGIGPAGTGKTYIALAIALDLIAKDDKLDIILFRPPVEVGAKMGHLPGDLDEKMAPHNEVAEEAIVKHIGREQYKKYIECGRIQYKAVGFQRGASYENKIVILDEAQNLTKGQIKMLLTRISENTKMILNGDDDQVDIPNSGLKEAVERLYGMDDSSVCTFTDDDSVRHPVVKEILKRYR